MLKASPKDTTMWKMAKAISPLKLVAPDIPVATPDCICCERLLTWIQSEKTKTNLSANLKRCSLRFVHSQLHAYFFGASPCLGTPFQCLCYYFLPSFQQKKKLLKLIQLIMIIIVIKTLYSGEQVGIFPISPFRSEQKQDGLLNIPKGARLGKETL